MKGKRDYAILALPVGCAFRRQELAQTRSRRYNYVKAVGSSLIFAARAAEFHGSDSDLG
jgi:hypothetical protein